jgi:hypothetical protein
VETNYPLDNDTQSRGAPDNTAQPERVGVVIRTGDNQYKLIDPKTGGAYIVKTDKPWADERLIKHINMYVRKHGRAPAGETLTVEVPG